VGVAIEPVDVEKVTEENAQSRFRITDNANLAPGVCALCGSAGGDGRQFIDFGKTMDWYGAVYFCTWCIGEAAKLLGLVSSRSLEILTATYENLHAAHEGLKFESKAEIDAARILLRNCHCDPDSTNPTVLDSLEADPEPEPDNSTPDQPIGLEGFVDLPSFGSDDESDEKPKRRGRNTSSS
jgi:hypothetical protein